MAQNEMNYPVFNDSWREVFLKAIRNTGTSVNKISELQEQNDYRDGIGEHDYIREAIREYLYRNTDFFFVIEKSYIDWVLENNTSEIITENKWDNEDLVLNDLIFDSDGADMNSFLEEAFDKLTDEELYSALEGSVSR